MHLGYLSNNVHTTCIHIIDLIFQVLKLFPTFKIFKFIDGKCLGKAWQPMFINDNTLILYRKVFVISIKDYVLAIKQKSRFLQKNRCIFICKSVR